MALITSYKGGLIFSSRV